MAGTRARSRPEARTVRLLFSRSWSQLITSAASVGLKANTSVSLREGGVSGLATVRVPGTGRWLNVTSSTLVGMDRGRLSVSEPRLRIGRLTVPPLLLDTLAPLAVVGLRGDRDLRRVLPAVQSLSLEAGQASLTYGRVEMPRGLVARLVWGEEASGVLHDAVYAHVDRLLDVLQAAPEGDARFGLALETAFAFARERSGQGSAVEENRAAVLALGVVLDTRGSRGRWGRSSTTSARGCPGASGSARRSGAGRTGRATSP